MRRCEPSDEGWAIIEPLLPPPASTGRPRRSLREKWNDVFWALRSCIEPCNGWLKECQHPGTRFEKLAVNLLAMLQLALIERYLRLLFSGGA
jgi:transposase